MEITSIEDLKDTKNPKFFKSLTSPLKRSIKPEPYAGLTKSKEIENGLVVLGGSMLASAKEDKDKELFESQSESIGIIIDRT